MAKAAKVIWFNYQIYPTGDPDLGESANALGIISAVVTNGTNVIFTTSARTLGTNYTLLVNDVTDTTSGPNTILTNSSIPLHYIVDLITMLDSAWKYNESGEELGTAWRNVGYDDGATGWSNGVALFEGKRGAIPATLLPIVRTTNDVSLVGANVKVTNFYYRTTFNFPWATNGSSLRVTHYIDDGAVFYLNGEHAYDIGMDLTGSLAATNFANRSVGDAASEGPFSVAMTNLHSGANLMAIEVHQATAGSSDITFAANLEAIIPSFDLAVLAPPPLAIQQVGPDAILSWPGSGFTLQGVGLL